MRKHANQTELDQFFKTLLDKKEASQTITKSAFFQARKQLSHTAFKALNQQINNTVYQSAWQHKTWKGFRLCAIDGTSVRLPDEADIIEHFSVVVNTTVYSPTHLIFHYLYLEQHFQSLRQYKRVNHYFPWEAIKDPYVKAWAEGRYGEAISRGVFDIGSLVIPAGVLAKIGKAGAFADALTVLKRAEVIAPDELAKGIKELVEHSRAEGKLDELIQGAKDSDTLDDLIKHGELTPDELGDLRYANTSVQTLGEPAASRVLGENLEAVGVSRPANHAAHHIVAGGDSRATQIRAILQREGIDINEAANGVFLSCNRGVACPPATTHSILHTNRYYREVTRRLSTVAPGSVRQELRAIANELSNGTFPY